MLISHIPAFKKFIGRTLLKIVGWEAVPLDKDVKKAVAILAPHTSTWDIILGMMIIMATGDDIKWIGKHTLFNWPLGGLLRSLGGIPLNREQAKDTVATIGEKFGQHDHFVCAISPEGTRSYRPYWRTGFYQIALFADVPLALYYLDFKNKVGGCGPILPVTGKKQEDMQKINDFYQNITPRNPHSSAPICFKT
ncbi:MAG: glycerol acyltransferase [Zetaproteobacteria bacterium]|nr:glycerol acyltransferase [Pseudobdellovibrionaceae bacterium]